MNGILTKAGWLVVAAALMAGISACNTADKLQPEDEASAVDAPKTYTLTVTATKGDDDATRALTLNGKTLNATWARGEKVDVYIEQPVYEMGTTIVAYYAYKNVGTLTAQGSGAETTLSGEVTLRGSSRPGLMLRYGSASYDYRGQKGTLEDVSANYDYATALIAKNKYTIENSVIMPDKPVSFSNRQAIVRFILKDGEGHPLSTDRLTVSATEGYTFNIAYIVPTEDARESTTTASSFDVVPASASGDFFIAMPACSSAADTFPFRLDITGIDGYNYFYEKDVNFEQGKYYEVTVKMKRWIDLSQLTSDYTAKQSDVLTGELPTNRHLSIAAGAEVTLMDVTISDNARAGITCLGSAAITLVGTNSVTSTASGYTGVQAGGTGTTLSIGGDGILTANGGQDAAGIGGGGTGTFGDITITGGTITATGGGFGAGIGSGGGLGRGSSCGSITISGGNVTATGGGYGAGIGSGGGIRGSCGNISISGGNVTATGGGYGAGIGSGDNSSCGNITIGGQASGSAHAGKNCRLDIGAGESGTCGQVTVEDGTISGYYYLVPCVFRFSLFYIDHDAYDEETVYIEFVTSTINVHYSIHTFTVDGSLQDDNMTNVVTIDLPPMSGVSMSFSQGDGSDGYGTLDNVTISLDGNNEFSVELRSNNPIGT